MKGLVLEMARHKIASNVVERVLACADSVTRHGLIDEILAMEHSVDSVHAMMMDAYGSAHNFFLPASVCKLCLLSV